MASLASDTGVSNADGITSNRSIGVGPLASDGIDWSCSVNKGSTWNTADEVLLTQSTPSKTILATLAHNTATHVNEAWLIGGKATDLILG